MRFSRSSAAALALAVPLVAAQTSTSCNPLDTTCPADPGSKSSTISTDFTQGKSAMDMWTEEAGTSLSFGSNGAEFTMSQALQAPTIQTDFYIFFGRIDVKMRAAPGTGIVSSIVLLSDDLDEIDWEFLGGNTTTVETNFFGKGNTTSYDRATYQDVTSPQTETHTYTIDWNSDRIEWIIDGETVRTVTYDNSLTVYGKNYPQTPMRLKLGNWCGGCSSSEGTATWAGGPPNWSDGPFTMYVESVDITNTNPAGSYEYTGNSGSWQSIKLLGGGAVSGGSSGSGSGSASMSSGGSSGTTAGSPSASANPNNYTRTASGGSGSTKTQTSLITATKPAVSGAPSGNGASSPAGASATPSQSSTGSPSMQNSASSLAMMSSTALLALLFGFMLL